ncbi:MAG: phenylacetate--CoA ligase family protein, partial [Methylobacter sp.]
LTDAQCSCGRGLPLLKEIQGRTTDFIVAQDGTVLHGLALIYVLRDLPGIESFKIIQHNLAKTQLLIVRNGDYSQEISETLIQEVFKKRLGKGVKVGIEYLAEIPKEQSGKFRYVVSHIKS